MCETRSGYYNKTPGTPGVFITGSGTASAFREFVCWVVGWDPLPLSAYPPIERPRWGPRGLALSASG